MIRYLSLSLSCALFASAGGCDDALAKPPNCGELLIQKLDNKYTGLRTCAAGSLAPPLVIEKIQLDCKSLTKSATYATYAYVEENVAVTYDGLGNPLRIIGNTGNCEKHAFFAQIPAPSFKEGECKETRTGLCR